VFDSVKRCVEAYLRDHASAKVRTDRVVSFDATNRLIDGCCYLFFGEDERFPAFVAKAARTPGGKAVFDVEYENLETLEARGMNAAGPAVPAPLGRWLDGETLVTLQSALVGVPMANKPGASLFSPDTVDASFDRVLEWWLHFQRCYGTRRVELAGDAYADEVLEPVQLFRRRFLLDREEIAFLTRRYEIEKTLEGVELALMARHGDFCASNLVLQERGIGVFDWEFPLRFQAPMFDLFFFFSSVRFPHAGRGGESSHFESFASIYWDESYFKTAVCDRLRRACEQCGVPREALADLFLLSLIQVANMKYDGLLESHGVRDVEPASNEEKRARWSIFEQPDLDAPFACIRSGVFENLRLVVRRGLPEL
jgi:hypothetical protein